MNNSEALGRMVWLMGHSRHHAAYKVSDIYRLILPAIANYQFRVWDGENNPQGFMIWAWLTDEASSEYEKGSNHITGQDFVGGNNLWLVEVVMPFNNVRAMLSEGRKHLIGLYGKGTQIKFRRTKNNLFKKGDFIMGDSPSSDSGSNNESRMSPGRATAQFGAEVGSLAGGYTESQVQDAIDQNESSDDPRTNVEIAREARIPGTFTQQSQNYVDDFSGATDDRKITSRGTSTAELPSLFPTDFTRDYSDFTTADQLTSMSNSINNPLSNVLTRLGLPTTQNRINQGYTPIYTGPKGNQQITGTMNYGIGMGMPTNDLNMTGSGSDVPGYNRFAPVTPTTNVPMDMGDDGGGNEQTLIRRNPNDPVDEIVEETPPLSDQLATDFLQNPFYLYSGIGNQYQPYGYAQGTLVDLLRTRNLTQPQQAAANLGLFGNPGDFS